MDIKIIIDARMIEKRIAILENGKLVDLKIERPSSQPMPGSIYKGRVTKVLPGMQAAFVDIGTEKNGFIHRDDLVSFQRSSYDHGKKQQMNISSFVKEGEELLVQVVKEEFGTKGAKLTGMLSIPGRHLVYLPKSAHVGVSKKIKSSDEREKWREIGQKWVGDEDGMIFRTSSEGQNDKALKIEYDHLARQYEAIIQQVEAAKCPSLIHQENNWYERIGRYIVTKSVEEIIIDDRDGYETLLKWAENASGLKEKIKLYTGKENIFAHYAIESEIEKALWPHVWLKNGASLRIDHTEALTVIDVNTDKYIGRTNRQETVLNTNLLAAEEIARQIRLRDISGMIVIDFITMKEKEDQSKVIAALKRWLTNDPMTTVIYGFTAMGVLELTRKKERRPLYDVLSSKCPVCSGTGHVLSAETIAYQLERALWERRFMDEEGIWIECSGQVAGLLKEKYGEELNELENILNYKITMTETEYPYAKFEIRHVGTIDEIQKRINRYH